MKRLQVLIDEYIAVHSNRKETYVVILHHAANMCLQDTIQSQHNNRSIVNGLGYMNAIADQIADGTDRSVNTVLDDLLVEIEGMDIL